MSRKIYFLPNDVKAICLTFDDGPCQHITPAILQILKTYGIKATFFVIVKNALKYPDLIQTMLAEGHSVELHGFTHKSFKKYILKDIFVLLKKNIDLMQQHFSITPSFLRPPFGNLKTQDGFLDKVDNMSFVGWSVAEKDNLLGHLSHKTERLLFKTIPGSIILMHDTNRYYPNYGVTLQLLNKVLPILLEKGFIFVSIPQLITFHNHHVVQTFNGIPLLKAYLTYYKPDGPTLRLYWDINAINENKDLIIHIQSSPKDKHPQIIKTCYPSKIFMSKWPQVVLFEKRKLTPKTQIYIQQNNGELYRIIP